MNILITGAGGFAGRNLIQYFSHKGYNVVGTWHKKKPCFNNEEITSIKLVHCDLSEKIDIDGNFDSIIHTAALLNGSFEELKRNNIDSMSHLIDFARIRNVKNFVNFSTRSIYGKVITEDVTEETDVISPDHYGLSKYVAECLLRNANDVNGISLRLPGITGLGAHNTWLVNIVEQFKKKETVTISDFYTYNFVYIMDIAVFIEKLITNEACTRYKYDVVNLACNKGAGNIQIAKEIKRRTKSVSDINIINSPQKKSGLFRLISDKAYEMGFVSHSVMEIVDIYLKSLGY